MDEEDRCNEEEAAEMFAQYSAWLESIDNDALPIRKREGYAEMMMEAADMKRKEMRESL